MPTYDFKDLDTGEVTEYVMSWKELDKFKEDNPNLKQVIGAATISYDGGQSVLGRAGDGWKEVQDRIKSGMPPQDRSLIKSK